MIGVDYDLFWTLNPKSLSPFIKAFKLKQKQADVQNYNLGLYIRMAIASCMDKNSKYPNKPLMDKHDEPMSAEEIKRRFMAHAQLINQKFERG